MGSCSRNDTEKTVKKLQKIWDGALHHFSPPQNFPLPRLPASLDARSRVLRACSHDAAPFDITFVIACCESFSSTLEHMLAITHITVRIRSLVLADTRITNTRLHSRG